MTEPANAAGYDHAQILAPLHELIARRISALVPPGGRVLDLGSGSARLLVRLASRRPDITITGMELSGPMLELAERNVAAAGFSARIELKQGDVTSLPDAIEAEAVSSSLTVHHLPDVAAAISCLRGIARLRARCGSAVWLFDLARLSRPWLWHTVIRATGGREKEFRADAIRSERAAFTVDELRALLDVAELRLHSARTRPLPLFQAHWAPPCPPAGSH